MRWVVNATPRPLYPREKTRYPFYTRLGGTQGRSGRVRKISPPTGFHPRTVQPVASRYTNYAISAHTIGQALLNNLRQTKYCPQFRSVF